MGGSIGHTLDPTGGNFLGTGNIPFVGSGISRIGGDVATGGLAEFGQKRPFDPYDLLQNRGAEHSQIAYPTNGGPGNTPGVPTFGMPGGTSLNPVGQTSPTDMLVQSGGASLLSQIALGVKADDALASYFGQSPATWNNYKASLSDSERKALDGLSNNLNSIQTDVNTKNQVLHNLTQDFPNFMANQSQKYASLMDNATKNSMNLALQQSAAKYAAGGNLSSGAMAEASARVGAQYGQQNQMYGTQLAMQDWNNQYSEASALRNFQQKMLGQGVDQGFNAVQASLGRNFEGQTNSQNLGFRQGMQNQQLGFEGAEQTQRLQYGLQGQQNEFGFQQGLYNQQQSGAMWGALGGLGGTLLGGLFGGPLGAAAGGQAGKMMTGSGSSGFSPNSNLNLGGTYRYGSWQ